MSDPMERVRMLGKRVREVRKLAGTDGGLVAGSVYEARTRCGRQGCKCMASDYRHVNRCLSLRHEGKSRTRTVADQLAEEAERATHAYRSARTARRLIARTATELLKDIDELIADAASRGQRRMLAGLQEAGKDSK